MAALVQFNKASELQQNKSIHITMSNLLLQRFVYLNHSKPHSNFCLSASLSLNSRERCAKKVSMFIWANSFANSLNKFHYYVSASGVDGVWISWAHSFVRSPVECAWWGITKSWKILITFVCSPHCAQRFTNIPNIQSHRKFRKLFFNIFYKNPNWKFLN